MDLATREAMEKVIARSEETFDGRRLLIKDGKNFEGRPAVRTQRYHVQSTGRIGGTQPVPVENGEGTAELEGTKIKVEKARKEKKTKRTKETVQQ